MAKQTLSDYSLADSSDGSPLYEFGELLDLAEAGDKKAYLEIQRRLEITPNKDMTQIESILFCAIKIAHHSGPETTYDTTMLLFRNALLLALRMERATAAGKQKNVPKRKIVPKCQTAARIKAKK